MQTLSKTALFGAATALVGRNAQAGRRVPSLAASVAAMSVFVVSSANASIIAAFSLNGFAGNGSEQPYVTNTFDASASTDTSGSLTSYVWNFGDGLTATGITASHSFGHIGSYNITLTAYDNNGQSALSSHTENVVVTTPPVANIGGPYYVPLGSALMLDASASYAPFAAAGDPITLYSWIINGRSATSITGVQPTISAATLSNLGVGSVGTYSLQLRVTDSLGNNATLSTTFFSEVAPVPLPAAAWLMLSGLGGLGAFARKRKAA